MLSNTVHTYQGTVQASIHSHFSVFEEYITYITIESSINTYSTVCETYCTYGILRWMSETFVILIRFHLKIPTNLVLTTCQTCLEAHCKEPHI